MSDFKLTTGKLAISKGEIMITDDGIRQYRYRLFSAIGWMFFGVISIFRYFKTGDDFLLYTGVVIAVGHLIALILTLLRTNAKTLDINEVKSWGIKNRWGTYFLDLNLKNGRYRRVIIKKDEQAELEKFLKLQL